MKAATIKDIKTELNELSTKELQDLCLRLSRFKLENKELLTYLLFDSHNESQYIENVKNYIDTEFLAINTKSIFYIKKSVRKILKNVKKYIRYSQNKATEAELLIYFCKKLKHFKPSIKRSTQLQNLYNRQLLQAKKRIDTLHEDLQYDYNLLIEKL
ncbi:hypothetical protein PK35_01395 [Tamlana nanhaiensis]|uniref:Uncharacterized protein n=1 Tax=Neotamlana nanhaiensis TaxID=1382798 RepID=A0A0D7W9P2_9FLAO|nr:hypothetical protein [Tamlana nanhaiensis]KJD34477.1 hypothetical protein PK35_01395 [Tamlana nanhaiensis]